MFQLEVSRQSLCLTITVTVHLIICVVACFSDGMPIVGLAMGSAKTSGDSISGFAAWFVVAMQVSQQSLSQHLVSSEHWKAEH